MAPSGQCSPQVRQTTWEKVRQPSPIRTFNPQATPSGLPWVSLQNAALVQASRQALQNVHAPKAKFTCGKPPRPFSRIFSGHAAMHAPERWQLSMKSASSFAHGGLRGTRLPLKSPLKNRARLTDPTILFTRYRHPQLKGRLRGFRARLLDLHQTFKKSPRSCNIPSLDSRGTRH